LYSITNSPVIILSSPRTGSSALAIGIFNQLKNTHDNIQLFNEPFHHDQFPELTSAINNNTDYVLKVHIKDLLKHHYPKQLLNIISNHQCFLIRIRRRNVVAQITSKYIADLRDVWGYPTAIKYEAVTEINIKKIIGFISDILDYNKTLDNYPVPFDLDLYYEDLKFSDTGVIRTPQPENYLLIEQLVTYFLRKHNDAKDTSNGVTWGR
jgi:hypothetical protein